MLSSEYLTVNLSFQLLLLGSQLGFLFVEMKIGQFLLREFHSEFVRNSVIFGKQFIIFDKKTFWKIKQQHYFWYGFI